MFEVMIVLVLLGAGFFAVTVVQLLNDIMKSARLIVKITEQTRVANDIHYDQLKSRIDRLNR